jgi:NAD(P)H-flavin reductase
MALVFVIFFFFHCDFRLSSWDYFIATAVLYTLSWLYSQCKTYFEHGLRHKARLLPESEHTLRIAIDTRMEWGPGQHVFLRFITCGMHTLTAHPFTICSVPQRDCQNQLVFYVKARGGLTGRLMALARKNPDIQIPVLIDGPYGGIPAGRVGELDRNIAIGGGAGAGTTLSLIEDFIRFTPAQTGREMKVIVATRDPGMRAWYIQALKDLAMRQPQEKPVTGLSIHIHETFTESTVEQIGTNIKTESGTESLRSKESSPSTVELFNIQFLTGRPDLPVAIQQLAGQDGVSVGVVVCGPSSMIYDVREAASDAQRDILSSKPGCARELWLHSEKFS